MNMKKPVGRRFFSPKTSQSKEKVKEEVPLKEDELVTYSFESGSEDDFDVLCNMVSVLPMEYNCVTEVTESEDYEEEEMGRYKPIC